MRPIIVKETNGVLRAPPGQEDTVYDLPVQFDRHCVTVSSHWRLTWRERLRVLRTGIVKFTSVGRTHPPIRLEVGD